MSRRPIRIATTEQLERSVREAGFEAYMLPELPDSDSNRSLRQRLDDGDVYRPFLEKHNVDLVLDHNTSALTLSRSEVNPDEVSLTTATLGIPYVASYLGAVTSTMSQVQWPDHWRLLESDSWIKWIYEVGHGEELIKLGVPNVIMMPPAVADDDFDTNPLPEPDPGPAVAFMGDPASSWFRSTQTVQPGHLLAGLTAAGVHADMPDLTFHKIFFDLYQSAVPPQHSDDPARRAAKTLDYYNKKSSYNAYLAVKQCDRFARFLKVRLGDAFELIGEHWDTHFGLGHSPRITDMKVLHERIRRVPICLNLVHGDIETGLNSRHFEITACGGFMLTYPTPELGSCFEIGKECDVFHSEAELLDKIAYYLSHSGERREIAAAGQRRTLSGHLYSHRITKLVELLHTAGVLPKKVSTAEAAHPKLPKIHVQGVTTQPAPETAVHEV